jgi:phage virion morphogenesis protein
MAGASFTVEFDDLQLQLAFRRLAAAAQDPEPLLDMLGAKLVESTVARFTTNEGPDGKPWAALNPAYAEIRRTGPILVQGAALRDSMTFRTGPRELVIGSPMIYAAIHQFGGKIVPKKARALRFNLGDGVGGLKRVAVRSVVIPARPYLGISEQDRIDIVKVANGFLGRVLAAP